MAPNNMPRAQAFQTKSKPAEIRASNIEAGKGTIYLSWFRNLYLKYSFLCDLLL